MESGNVRTPDLVLAVVSVRRTLRFGCVFGLYIGLGTQKERAAGNPLKVLAGDMEARI